MVFNRVSIRIVFADIGRITIASFVNGEKATSESICHKARGNVGMIMLMKLDVECPSKKPLPAQFLSYISTNYTVAFVW